MDLIAGTGKLINPGTIKRYRLVSIGFRILTRGSRCHEFVSSTLSNQAFSGTKLLTCHIAHSWNCQTSGFLRRSDWILGYGN